MSVNPVLTPRSNWQYNIYKCLDGLDVEERPLTVIKYNSTVPCCKQHSSSSSVLHLLNRKVVSAFLAFGSTSGCLGEAVIAQLTVVSQAHKSSAAITLSDIEVTFEGGLEGFSIRHDPTSDPIALMSKESSFLYKVPLKKTSLLAELVSLKSPLPDSVPVESPKSPLPEPSLPATLQVLSGSADLNFPPGVTKVFEAAILPSDAGHVSAAKATLSMQEEQFSFSLIVPLHEPVSRTVWWLRSGTALTKKKLDVEHTCSMTVLPKPPKMKIEFPGLRKAYYADERVDIQIQIMNEEEEDAVVRLEVQLLGSLEKMPGICWVSTSDSEDDQDQQKQDLSSSGSQPAKRPLGLLAPAAVRLETLQFQALPDMAEYALEIKAHYHLSSDPQTPISKAVTKDLVFIKPFDGKFDFMPRVYPDPWPSYFHYDEDETNVASPDGLKQQWSITTRLASFALEPLLVYATSLKILETSYGAGCKLLAAESTDPKMAILSPNSEVDHVFDVEIQKTSIEDRRSSIVRLQLEVLWSLESAPGRRVTTIIPIPQFTVPFGEPRVLAAAQLSSQGELPLVHISYTLENPSVHLLTFQLTMEASEEFAFSGPKTGSVQLVPLSRHTVHFNLLPTRRNMWIRPNLKVVDVGFAKTLKVLAAEGCKGDKKGLAVWVPE